MYHNLCHHSEIQNPLYYLRLKIIKFIIIERNLTHFPFDFLTRIFLKVILVDLIHAFKFLYTKK